MFARYTRALLDGRAHCVGLKRAPILSNFRTFSDASGTVECPHALNVKKYSEIIASLNSNADDSSSQVSATRALRQALTEADESYSEANEGGPENLGLHLTSRLETLGALHSKILDAAQSMAAVEAAPEDSQKVDALRSKILNAAQKKIEAIEIAVDPSEKSDEAIEDAAEEGDDVTEDLVTESPIPAVTLTFGTTPFETVAAAFSLLETRYGLSSAEVDAKEGKMTQSSQCKKGAWLDLGSGDGGPTLAAALLRHWPLGCGGLEVRKSLHQQAEHVAIAYTQHQDEIKAATGGSHGSAQELSFVNGDFRRNFGGGVQVENVSVLFLHATCFDDGLMQEVARLIVPRLPAGAFVVSASKPLPSEALQTLEARRVPFSWGEGTLHFQRKLEGHSSSPDPSAYRLKTLYASSCLRLSPDHTPALDAMASPLMKNGDGSGSNTSGLEVLSSQLLSAVSSGHLGLAMESAAVLGLAAGCETNARSLVEAKDGDLVASGLVPLLHGGTTSSVHDPRLKLGAKAAAVLCCASLAQHFGCVEALVSGGAFDQLVHIVDAEMKSPTLPPALLGAACAALGSCAVVPQQAAALRSSGLEDQMLAMKNSLEETPLDLSQAGLLESSTAALAAIERFAHLCPEK